MGQSNAQNSGDEDYGEAEVPRTVKAKVRQTISNFDTQLSRWVFGEDNKMSRSIRANMEYAKIRMKSQYKSPEGERLFAPKEMKHDGFMVFENQYNDQFIKTIQSKVTDAFKDESKYEERAGKYSIILSDFFKDVPEAKDILKPSIIKAMGDYYQSHFYIPAAMCWRNYPVDEDSNEGNYARRWHADQRYPTIMKLFYLVNDTTEEDGPLHIVKRQQSKHVVRNDYNSRHDPGESVTDHVFKLTGKAGTICIGNTTYCLHRAGVPSPGHYRDIIQFIFMPSFKPLRPDWENAPELSCLKLGKRGK